MVTERNSVSARGVGLDVEESLDRVALSGAFDCITIWHTLEHMPDIPFTLSNIARLLKPGGKLVIAVPDSGGTQAVIFGPNWLHADVPRHLFHFDSKALMHRLNEAGFSVRTQWHQEFEYDLLGWSQSALNLLLLQPNVFFDSLRGRPEKKSQQVYPVLRFSSRYAADRNIASCTRAGYADRSGRDTDRDGGPTYDRSGRYAEAIRGIPLQSARIRRTGMPVTT